MTVSHQQTSQMSQSSEHLNSNIINCCLKAGCDVDVLTARCCLKANLFFHVHGNDTNGYVCGSLLVAFLMVNY